MLKATGHNVLASCLRSCSLCGRSKSRQAPLLRSFTTIPQPRTSPPNQSPNAELVNEWDDIAALLASPSFRRALSTPRQLRGKEATATEPKKRGRSSPLSKDASSVKPRRSSTKAATSRQMKKTATTTTTTKKRQTSDKTKDRIKSAGEENSRKDQDSYKPSRPSNRDFEPFKVSLWGMQPLNSDMPPIPRLAHGLDRTLFNPGLIQLRDLHSRVYNFDPYLETVTPANEIDFNTLKDFTPPSKDHKLTQICKENNLKYYGSTSSMSGVLSHFHFLLSSFRPVSLGNLSEKISKALPSTITEMQRNPEGIFLRRKDSGYYGVDSDKQDNFSNVLSLMGRYLERFLTVDKAEFERHKKGIPKPPGQGEVLETEAHHFTAIGDVLIRSQLDAYDPRLPGSGVFDLKTRAVLPVRMDPDNFQDRLGYELRQMQGQFESYEREVADMCRSTLLKYSLQARMGRMDGIFVAFHNIVRLFGFQYFNLNDIDLILHGQSNRTLGDTEFLYSVHLLNKIFDIATEKFPEQTLRINFDTIRDDKERARLDVFVEPMADELVEQILTSRRRESDQWDERFLETGKTSQVLDPSTSEPQAHALEFCDKDPQGPVMHISLNVSSEVNGSRVLRPENLKPWDSWDLKHSIRLNDEPGQVLPQYRKLKKRLRDKIRDPSEDDGRLKHFLGLLSKLTERSKSWRSGMNKNDALAESLQGGVRIWNRDEPVKREHDPPV